jgi:hypothetical protein
VCGFFQFSEPPGSYDICRLCGWEDDNVQLADPHYRGGANEMSLAEAQRKLLQTYPAHMRRLGEYERDPEWRPLREDDVATLRADAPRYYWRRDS